MELIICLILLAIVIPAIYAALIGAPTVPSTGSHIKKSLISAGIKEGIEFYELGTGTGKISLMAMNMGAHVTGYELSPVFYAISYLRMFMTGKKFRLKLKNFMRDDLSEADVIYLFLMPETIEKVAEKLSRELRSGTKIISYAFPIKRLPILEEIKTTNKPSIFLYEIK